MIWHQGVVYALEQTGLDETRKPVCEPVELTTARFRLLPVRPVHDRTSGNWHDRIEKTVFTKKPPDKLRGASRVSLCGCMWTVEHISAYRDGSAVTMWRAK